MKKLFLLLFFFSALSLSANTRIREFRSANELLRKRQYAKAAAAFETLVKKTSRTQRIYAMRRQCEAMARIRKGGEALKIAAKIPDPVLREYTVMQILSISRQYKKLIDQFGKKDLNLLPDDIIHHGFYMRAEALEHLKQYSTAFKDIDRCIAECGSDMEQKMLACMWGTQLAYNKKNHELVLKYADQALKETRFRESFMFLRPMTLKAKILIAEKDFAGAEKCLALAPANLKKTKGVWGCRFNILSGDLALARGRKSQAADFYRQALICAGKTQHLIIAAQKKLASVK